MDASATPQAAPTPLAPPVPSDTLAVRALCAATAPRFGDHFALRALLKAHELLATALGIRLAELRESDMPDAQRFAKMHELSWQLPAALSAARILGERWKKIPERHRPHYTPEQRYEILRIKGHLVLSAKETADLFALSAGTIHRWISDLLLAQQADPNVAKIGEKLQPTPPVRRYADVFRRLLKVLSVQGVGGAERIARVVARHGFKVSARTVARVRKEETVTPGPPLPDPDPKADEKAEQKVQKETPAKKLRVITTRGPLDKVLVDITHVRSLFGLFTFRLAVVLDLHSRFPLAFAVFSKAPSAADMVALVEKALRFGKPRVLISDKGEVFRARLFESALRTLGIEHRFGAVGRHGSICTLERLWRSVKAALQVKALEKDLVLSDFHSHVAIALMHYSFYQPHAGLKGATPAEALLQLPPACQAAVHPPRGRPGQVVPFPTFEVEHLAPGFPILVRKAA
jgi:transposase InsO family protein